MNAAATANLTDDRMELADLGALKALARIHLDAGQHEAAAKACGLISNTNRQRRQYAFAISRFLCRKQASAIFRFSVKLSRNTSSGMRR